MPISTLADTITSVWMVSKLNNGDPLFVSFLVFVSTLISVSFAQTTFV